MSLLDGLYVFASPENDHYHFATRLTNRIKNIPVVTISTYLWIGHWSNGSSIKFAAHCVRQIYYSTAVSSELVSLRLVPARRSSSRSRLTHARIFSPRYPIMRVALSTHMNAARECGSIPAYVAHEKDTNSSRMLPPPPPPCSQSPSSGCESKSKVNPRRIKGRVTDHRFKIPLPRTINGYTASSSSLARCARARARASNLSIYVSRSLCTRAAARLFPFSFIRTFQPRASFFFFLPPFTS